MAREGEENKSLVRRTTPTILRPILRPTTAYGLNDGSGRTVYYTSGRGVSLVTSPGLLSDWYGRVNDWCQEFLRIVLKSMEGIDGTPDAPRPREFTDNVDEAAIRITVLALRLLMKAGHVVLLTVLAGGCLAYERIAQTGAPH
jgi:hypothetical protein